MDQSNSIIPIALEEELSSSFGRYAQYVILERAIPDIRDGLKPVHRRIIYAMWKSRNHPDRPYRKSAKTVGDVMGNYHPHGDQSIYHAMVRMIQPWKLRLPLVQGHGNFGSMDDDPPAAMRYTEARLAKSAMALMRDIEQNTVTFRPTFDDSSLEPTVLPAAFPNLLVNGTSGVSAGFATEIPPHNLGEVIDALLALIDNPALTLAEAREHIKGPDFPTGGILMGEEGLQSAYQTGKGRIYLRSRCEIDKPKGQKKASIIVSEIPYGVVKSTLVTQLEQLVAEGAVRGVADIRDESDRSGLRIVIDLERNADAAGVLNFYFRKTQLQVTYNFNMIAIAAKRPQRHGLLSFLRYYLEHRRDVVLRRSEYALERAQKRLHEVEGLIRAIDILDEIIATIRASKDKSDARKNLVKKFAFSEVQAEAILVLRLHRLTNLEIKELTEEAAALHLLINELSDILGNEAKMWHVIRRELLEMRREFADDRRTEVVDEAPDMTVALTVTVPPQTVIISITNEGYIKRCHPRSEQDPHKVGVRPGDYFKFWLRSHTTHRLLVFTDRGQCYNLPVHTIPEAKWTATGVALINLLSLSKSERVVAAISVPPKRRPTSLILVTRRGSVKRTAVEDFISNRSTGLVAIKLSKQDSLLSVMGESDVKDLMLITHGGMSIRFPIEEIRIMGRPASGVMGMRLNPNDEVACALTLPAEVGGKLALITASGKAKCTQIEEYEPQHRAGKGILAIRRLKRGSHHIVAAVYLPQPDKLLLQTPANAPLELETKEIPNTKRDGNAFTVAAPSGGNKIVLVMRDQRYEFQEDPDAENEEGEDDESQAEGEIEATATPDPAGPPVEAAPEPSPNESPDADNSPDSAEDSGQGKLPL